MRISDWSSDVCSSDLQQLAGLHPREVAPARIHQEAPAVRRDGGAEVVADRLVPAELDGETEGRRQIDAQLGFAVLPGRPEGYARSEENTSELQSLLRTSYAVFCLKY